MTTWVIYKHTSPSGKAYIGQTKNLNQRSSAHKVPSSKCIAFRFAIEKYGWKTLKHEILADNLTLEEANTLEEQFILEHNTQAPNGYNLRSGGLNQLASDELKTKLSRTRKGKSRSPEHQEKLNNAARTRIRSPEHETKLMEAVRRPKSEETKQKIAQALKNYIKTKEHKQKLSKAGLNRKHSIERRQRQTLRNTGRRIYVDSTTGVRKYRYPTDVTTSPLDS